jgi:hypothetical protein
VAVDSDVVASLVASSTNSGVEAPELPTVIGRSSEPDTAPAAVADVTGAIQPKVGEARRPPKVARQPPTRTLRAGDLVCGSCGEANEPARRFCSRCGHSLASADTHHIAWWKRLIPHRRRDRLAAGSRPWQDANNKKRKKRRSGNGPSRAVIMVRRGLGIALLLIGLTYGLYEPFRSWVDTTRTDVKDSVMGVIRPQFEPVTVGPGTTANIDPELDPEHPARFATDGFKNTHWLAPPPGPDLRPTLDLTLTDTVDVAKVIVHNGASDDFQVTHRPKTLLFIFDNGNQDEIELSNTPEPQEIDLDGGDGVERLKVIVTSIYESIDGTTVALTEIEFFAKS